MGNLKTLNINGLERNTTSVYQLKPWLDQKTLSAETDIYREINLVNQRYLHNKKWVLVVSSDKQALSKVHQLSKSNNEQMLWVHANKVNVAQIKIEQTLMRGNCAAVVLCNAQLSNDQLRHIEECATKGQTHCVVLNQAKALH
ncbi:hypothetical protein HII17_12890 [Thalassotalea sp. M1531]|uniref:Cell division inhibitor SulA n=1 Tax=Thalassotalea algicola TaxID=2716224 RepID=A0A7Y0LDB3_9GAMM|nr:hypothetical protein [Thalassotalea algicola]NMP32460.1 hypothetical protein [Thalassotalea algicola]